MSDQVTHQAVAPDAMPTGGSSAGARAQNFLGIPFSALIETFVFYAVLLLIDYFLLDGKRFWGLAPHPFWIPVLVLTMHYGTNAGLLAATLGSAFLLLGNVPEQSMNQDLYTYVGAVVLQPVLWFLAALILGELRMRHIRERERLKQKVHDLTEKANVISDAYQRLHKVKLGLEHRIATHMKSVVSLYDAAKAIENLNEGEIYQSVGQLIKSILNPDKFSLFLEDAKMPGKYSLVTQEGWQEGDGFSSSFDATSLLYKSVIVDQLVLCVSNPEHQRILGKEGVMAGPLFDQERNRVIGFLKVEQVPFMELTLTSVENLRILCDWLGMSISKSERIKKIENDSYMNPSRNLLNGGFMDYLTKFLGTLGKRLSFEIAMVTITPARAGQVTSDEMVSLTSVISDSVATVLRSIDLAFDCQKKQNSFILLLPATTVEGANQVVQKLESIINPKLTPHLKEIGLRFSIQKLS